MAFALGARSRDRLQGVHPDLVRVVERAIELTAVDFAVVDGLRSVETQRQYVAAGKSQTMNSKHLRQADGTGHAVDLCGFVGRELSWDMTTAAAVASAVRQAAVELGVRVRWGGCWACLNDTQADPRTLSADYVERRRRAGKGAFVDSPHFEMEGD